MFGLTLVLSCLVLSCLVLSCLVWSCLVFVFDKVAIVMMDLAQVDKFETQLKEVKDKDKRQ